MLRVKILLVALIALALTGCPEETAIWVEPESTASRLVFGVSRERGAVTPINFGVLNVSACETRDAYWVLSSTGRRVEHPLLVEYGVVPPGFVSDVGPRPLDPGCYLASVVGTGRTRFIVGEDGAVEELNDDERPT